MQGANDTESLPYEDCTRSALEFVHQLLVNAPQGPFPLQDVLAELAQAFAAPGAGVAKLPEGLAIAQYGEDRDEMPTASQPLPWKNRPEIIQQIGHDPEVLPVPVTWGGDWLLAPIAAFNGTRWLLWLEGASGRAWTSSEKAALALAGQCLAQWLNRNSQIPHWARQMRRGWQQQRLEDAALVVRRLAHDFGNVLTGILGFTELALAQMSADSPHYAYISEVHGAAQQGAQLTAQLRQVGRRQPVRPRPTSVAAVITNECDRLRQTWDFRMELRTQVPAELPLVAMDVEPLRQILSQVLDNARDATSGSGSVDISARLVQLSEEECFDLLGNPAPGTFVEIVVSDNGCGMDAEARQRLFVEPFFTTKPRHRGLGLATVYGILQSHRGGLRLEPGLEHGTMVRLCIPVASDSAAVVQPPSMATVGTPRVLVVDDDPMILQLVCTTLERAGYRVQAASNAAEAWSSYTAPTTEPFCLVLSDVVMPNMTGVDLARRLMSHDSRVNVLFMSGHVASDFAPQDLPNRSFDLLPKPFRPESLLRAVRTALDRGTVISPAKSAFTAVEVVVPPPR